MSGMAAIRTTPTGPLRTAASPRRVLLLGGDSDHNLGDQAILQALCALFHAADPAVQLTILSNRWPAQRFPGVAQVIPRGPRGWPGLAAAARSHAQVVVGGGGLFQDDDSRIKMPYWAARLRLLALLNGDVRVHAVGAGPLEHRESRWCARAGCGALRDLTVRDPFARNWLARCTDRSLRISPDPAFALAPAPPAAAAAFLDAMGLQQQPRILGVVVRRWFHPLGGFVPHRVRARLGLVRGSGSATLARLLDQLAAALRELAQRLDAAILLLPTYNVSHESDHRQCEALAQRLPDLQVRVGLIDDPALYKAVCGRLMLMMSARMHPLILAAGMGVPGVALGYNGKFEGHFDMLGIPRRLAWLDEFRNGAQSARLVALAEAALADPTDLRERCARLRERAARDVAALLDPALPGPAGQ
jgi:polysaccharide pyruvyl transferase WcaK-like protein